MRTTTGYLLVLLLLAAATDLPGAEVHLQRNQLQQLAQALSNRDWAEQQAFAFVALDELIQDYHLVLERAYATSGKTTAEQRKLYRWRAATQGFVNELNATREQLQAGAQLAIDATATGQVILHIGASPIVIEGPDVAVSGPLAERIITRHCGQFHCNQVLPAENQPTTNARLAELDNLGDGGFWSFHWGRGPRYESDDGLIFEFTDSTQRVRKQQACEAVVGELRRLALALRRALNAGYLINWASVEVRPGEDGLGEQVMLTQDGQFLRMQLPLLARSPQLPPELMTWLHAKVRGHSVTVELLHAEEFLMFKN